MTAQRSVSERTRVKLAACYTDNNERARRILAELEYHNHQSVLIRPQGSITTTRTNNDRENKKTRKTRNSAIRTERAHLTWLYCTVQNAFQYETRMDHECNSTLWRHLSNEYKTPCCKP